MSHPSQNSIHCEQAIALESRINDRSSAVGIIGMGYVGLPLAVATHAGGFAVVGFDIDPVKIRMLNDGESHIGRIDNETIAGMRKSGRFEVTSDYAKLAACDIIILCVPTPLNKYREPDLSYITGTTQSLFPHLRKGQLVVLESTTYPGTTREVMKPILEKGGLKSGTDFFMAFSPEREDPGNPNFHTATIPKVVGGDGQDATLLTELFYSQVVKRVVVVTSCEVAEAVKLTENIFRSVNIALVNELKIIYDRMGINVWEVIDAAKTKPFGFMPFYPGPGLGGHCIPIDPFYLTWKAREYNLHTRFIELAGEINTMAPVYVVEKLVDGLSRMKQKSLSGAKILMFGIAYKKNVEDTRESPAFALMKLIEDRQGIIDFYDPFVAEIPQMREHAEMSGRVGIRFDTHEFRKYDAAVICTDHDGVDYAAIASAMDLVIDTRNVMKDVVNRTGIIRA
jgi:UDP-N-acetyl-D-glucosamine dehydrogenase